MSNGPANFRECMAETSLQLLFEQGHFERQVTVRPFGVVDEQFTATGIFRQPSNGSRLVQDQTGEETRLMAALTVPDSVDLADRYVVVVDNVEWRVSGVPSSDGNVKTAMLERVDLHRTRSVRGV